MLGIPIIYAIFGFLLLVLIYFLKFFLSQIYIEKLHTRFVFITGCDTGFGNLLANTLDRKGVHVIAGCLRQDYAKELQEQSSSRLKTVVLDVTDKTSVENAFHFTKTVLCGNKLWGVVNNAGIMPSLAPVEWKSMETFEKTLNVNLFGTISVTKTFLPLVRQSKGRIVNVCSVIANCPYPGFSDYAISKTGAKVFTVCLRRELYSSGVTAHSIEPGGFKTGITDKGRVLNSLRSAYNTASEDSKHFYGGFIASNAVWAFNIFLSYIGTNTHPVIDAITHALFSKYPKRSYRVGLDANVIFKVFGWLPESTVDFILSWPKPYGPVCKELLEVKSE